MRMPAALLILAFCTTSPAQDGETDPDDESFVAEEEIEEIVVYGEKTLVSLRRDIVRAEQKFYELYNTMNSADEFDIHCGKNQKVGTHIRRWGCQANFVKTIYADATQKLRLGMPTSWVDGQIRRKDEVMRAEMTRLVEKSPALQDALNGVTRARVAYHRERLRRCYGKLICR